LRRQGWTILRFWNNDILENINGVIQMIVDHLNRSPLPTLPRNRERADDAAGTLPRARGRAATRSVAGGG
jgi:hypothetical protein